MNLIETKDGVFVFQIGKREKQLLCGVLHFYPLLNSTYHHLSKTANPKEIQSAQQLLETAMEEQRRENKKQLEAILGEAQRFQPNPDGYRLSLNVGQMDGLLQVLNDIRVGSWLRLGGPDESKGKPAAINADNAVYSGSMELSGYFQMALLDAFDRRG